MDPVLSARLDSSSDAQSMERTAGSLAECDKQRGSLQQDTEKKEAWKHQKYREIDYCT